MNKIRILQISHIFLRFWLGGLLIYSGVEKLRTFLWWRDDILTKMSLMPARLLSFGAASLPGIELVVGVALVVGLWKRAAALTALGLFAVFALSLTSVLARGIDADCGCFGPTSNYPVAWSGVARNCGFIALCWLLAVLPSHFARQGVACQGDSG